MINRFPKLYPLIDKSVLDANGASVAAFAAELATVEITLLQYRDKFSPPQQVLAAAAEITAAFAVKDCLFVMNDRPDLALLAGWRGVHVGQDDLPVGDIVAMLQTHPSAKRAYGWGTQAVGLSTHNDTQVHAAAATNADYLAIGPVFSTTTKLDAEPPVGLEGVRRARALSTKPLVAIGGITRENCRSVIDAGADSVAVMGGLFVPGMSVRAVVEDFLERLR